MRQELKTAARQTYQAFSQAYLRVFEEQDALISFLLHGLFASSRDRDHAPVDPMGGLTVGEFRELIDYFLSHRYQFVSPQQILNGLNPEGKYILLTFDDGYYNNSLALEALKEFGVPASFFISTKQVREKKAFWWDVLYRERLKAGGTRDAILAEGRTLKSMTTEEVETYLVGKFGNRAFETVGDIDRPFTEDELRKFASEPLVNIGNHTHNHAILTNYSVEGIRFEMECAQKSLYAMLGFEPDVISYPNGNYSAEVLQVATELGFKLGVTVDRRKNYLPLQLNGEAALRLGRFMPVSFRDLKGQYAWFRSDRVLITSKRERSTVLPEMPASFPGHGPGKINVLQLIEDFGLVGGAEKLVVDLLTNLDRNSFEPHVAIIGPRVLPSLCQSSGAKVHLIPSKGRLTFGMARRLNAIVRENDIHVIHSHLLKMNTLNGMVSRWCGRPGVGSIHGVLAHETSYKSRLYAKLAGWLNARTVVVSESLGKQYIKTYRVNPEKIITVFNGFDASRIIPPSEHRLAEFRRKFNCPEGRRVICAIGNVAEVKGYRYLIEAIAEISSTYPDIQLFIAGNDASRDESGSFKAVQRSARKELGLDRLVEKLGLQNQVVFLGEFREIALLFAVSRMYVCSSLHEGFSLTTVEAMAAGLPVVVTDCGGPTEIVRAEVDGLIVPIADSPALASAMKRLLSEQSLACRMGAAGRDRVNEHFSMGTFMEAHESLYRQICLRLMSPDLYTLPS